MMTERFVLESCMHNSDEVIEKVYFPQFKDSLDKVGSSPVNSGGYYSAVRYVKSTTFEEWKKIRYKEFRRARYPKIQDQLDMQFHDTVNRTDHWFNLIQEIKDKYPKE